MRNIIQIAIASVQEPRGFVQMALCDDGSTWHRYEGREWEIDPVVPRDDCNDKSPIVDVFP
jgi:hypothetical protein